MPPLASSNTKPIGLRGLGVVKGRRYKYVFHFYIALYAVPSPSQRLSDTDEVYRIVKDNIMGVTTLIYPSTRGASPEAPASLLILVPLDTARPAIRRLARRGGVMRISADIYAQTRIVLKERLTETIRQVILVMDSGTIPSKERKLVTTRDVSSHEPQHHFLSSPHLHAALDWNTHIDGDGWKLT
ncbi:hypothetical protein BDW74DRAFT_178458 [Aspergillus multicolor]|uniref:histone H4 n=1 Tax=Aspergillus multicolor TaxID=41759 RepID=UPI003CCCF809